MTRTPKNWRANQIKCQRLGWGKDDIGGGGRKKKNDPEKKTKDSKRRSPEKTQSMTSEGIGVVLRSGKDNQKKKK